MFVSLGLIWLAWKLNNVSILPALIITGFVDVALFGKIKDAIEASRKK